MREKQFIEQNKENWRRFEHFIDKENHSSPDEMNQLYIKITNDLSYARTYYNSRSVRIYLNQLAKTLYLRLYKHRSGKIRSFFNFWHYDLPLALFRSRKELNISLIFFTVAMIIGVVSSIFEPDFANIVLGDRYVGMTTENIARNEPMAVYGSSPEIPMFLDITFNNLLVAFYTYIFGAFFGVGTLFILLSNGIMVGTFQFFFIERGLFQESFLTIWMHGALEISAIVIAGAAGLTMSRGILFPGTLPRLQSFQIGVRRSIKIMLGLVPIFIIAAFIEGFFTRLTQIPDLIRASFITMCFAMVGLYFWWYPRRKFKNSGIKEYDKEELIPQLEQEINPGYIYKWREVFTAAFVIVRKLFVKITASAFLLATVYTVIFWLIGRSDEIDKIELNTFSIYNLYQFHNYNVFPQNIVLNVIMISTMIWLTLYFIKNMMKAKLERPMKINFMLFLKIAVIVSLFQLAVFTTNGLVILAAIIAIPFLMLWISIAAFEGGILPVSFARMISLLNGTGRYVFSGFVTIAIIANLLIFLFSSPFIWFYFEIFQTNIDLSVFTKITIGSLLLLFINQIGLAMGLALILSGQVVEYISAVEAKEAVSLKKRVEEIGIKRSAYGMERE